MGHLLFMGSAMAEFARPDLGDESVDNIVIVSLSKHGWCRLVLM